MLQLKTKQDVMQSQPIHIKRGIFQVDSLTIIVLYYIISVASLMTKAQKCSVYQRIHFVLFYSTLCLWTIQTPRNVGFPSFMSLMCFKTPYLPSLCVGSCLTLTFWSWNFIFKFQHNLQVKCEYRNQTRQHYEINGILKRKNGDYAAC